MMFSSGSGLRSTISMPSTKGRIVWLPTGPEILAPAVANRSMQKQLSCEDGRTMIGGGWVLMPTVSSTEIFVWGMRDVVVCSWGILEAAAKVGIEDLGGIRPGGGGNGKSLVGGHPTPAHTWKWVAKRWLASGGFSSGGRLKMFPG